MELAQRVIQVMDRAPDGWAQRVTMAEYATLDDERKRYYAPLYAKYRTKKVREYDQDSGNFVGWSPIQVGIGDPVGYKYVGYIAARAIDQILASNVLMARVLSKR